MANFDVYQVLLEVLAVYEGNARITQVILEYIKLATDPTVRASQTIIEVIKLASQPEVRVTQVIIEVLQGGPILDSYTDEAAITNFAF